MCSQVSRGLGPADSNQQPVEVSAMQTCGTVQHLARAHRVNIHSQRDGLRIDGGLTMTMDDNRSDRPANGAEE